MGVCFLTSSEWEEKGGRAEILYSICTAVSYLDVVIEMDRGN